MNWSVPSLFVSHRENTSSTYLFHSRGLILLLLIISVSTANIKMLSKETASLYVRAVSVCGKKSDAVCGFLAYFGAVLRFSVLSYAPPIYGFQMLFAFHICFSLTEESVWICDVIYVHFLVT